MVSWKSQDKLFSLTSFTLIVIFIFKLIETSITAVISGTPEKSSLSNMDILPTLSPPNATRLPSEGGLFKSGEAIPINKGRQAVSGGNRVEFIGKCTYHRPKCLCRTRRLVCGSDLRTYASECQLKCYVKCNPDLTLIGHGYCAEGPGKDLDVVYAPELLDG